jgi:hypothetical protein
MTKRENIVGSTSTFLLQADGKLEMADGFQSGGSTDSSDGSDPGTSDKPKEDKGLGVA